jgi:predicted Holliday junction resolvase-like endonuclease
MPTWLIIVIVVFVLLAIGGAIAARRRLAANEEHFEAHLQRVNRDLAAARAEDRGWERTVLEDAARRIYAERHDGAEPSELELVQVVDRPGTEEDKAVFRAGGKRLTLGRRDGDWVLDSLD